MSNTCQIQKNTVPIHSQSNNDNTSHCRRQIKHEKSTLLKKTLHSEAATKLSNIKTQHINNENNISWYGEIKHLLQSISTENKDRHLQSKDFNKNIPDLFRKNSKVHGEIKSKCEKKRNDKQEDKLNENKLQMYSKVRELKENTKSMVDKCKSKMFYEVNENNQPDINNNVNNEQLNEEECRNIEAYLPALTLEHLCIIKQNGHLEMDLEDYMVYPTECEPTDYNTHADIAQYLNSFSYTGDSRIITSGDQLFPDIAGLDNYEMEVLGEDSNCHKELESYFAFGSGKTVGNVSDDDWDNVGKLVWKYNKELSQFMDDHEHASLDNTNSARNWFNNFFNK